MNTPFIYLIKNIIFHIFQISNQCFHGIQCCSELVIHTFYFKLLITRYLQDGQNFVFPLHTDTLQSSFIFRSHCYLYLIEQTSLSFSFLLGECWCYYKIVILFWISISFISLDLVYCQTTIELTSSLFSFWYCHCSSSSLHKKVQILIWSYQLVTSINFYSVNFLFSSKKQS